MKNEIDMQQMEDMVMHIIESNKDGVHIWEIFKRAGIAQRKVTQIIDYLKSTNRVIEVNKFIKAL